MGSRKSILWMDLMRNKICPPPQKKTSRLSLSFLETFQNQNEVYLFDKILTKDQRLSRNNEYCTTNSILVDKLCHKQYLSPKHLPQTVS